ncbi:MAG: universal stress protein [Methanosarcinales archaeon]|jgi:nucleotide-binding universal stress UspA family protein|nr:universal stress protein [Methanosarcinales archaeon]
MEKELYKKILVATDGSANTARAIKYGIELARIADADVCAVYVLDTSACASMPMDAAWTSLYELLRAEGNEALKYVEEKCEQSSVPFEGVVLDGHPAHEIVDYANENEIDLIVMGTLGKTGLDRILLGSVASTVAHTSSVPVMIIRSIDIDEGTGTAAD